MRKNMFNIVCFADDVVLLAENENYLQKLVYNFNKMCQKYNMKIVKMETGSIAILDDSLRCKLVVDDRSIEYK